MNGQDLPSFDSIIRGKVYGRERRDNRSLPQRIREDYGEEAYKRFVEKGKKEDHDGDEDPWGSML
jgi:hypothetical protein